jgi:predicted Fe-Mo cluster-binding NifX family protein
MKIALSVWKDCISTVFDAADQLLILEIIDGAESGGCAARLTSSDGPARAMQLKEMGVDTLICGAVSRLQEAAIAAAGIEVHAFVRGTVEEVVHAYQNGRLQTEAFALPGCRRRGMGRRRNPGRGRNGACPWR